MFRSFDEDKSGSIDYVEFRRGLAHIGMELTDAEFGSLLSVVDNDKSVSRPSPPKWSVWTGILRR